MASRALPLNRSSRTSLDQEREHFEKNQTMAISKAINEIEAPVKAKHVRRAIIGTFQENGSQTFWSIVMRIPIQSNPIAGWKFCHTLHKLLREGHPNVLKDSQAHRDLIVDHAKLWGYLKEGYGKLINLYCHLLISKLDFHRRNPRFPGNLMISDDELERICENDINNYFQLSVELLDYMDEILTLQAAVFGSLDMSRSNSMTNAGQCRLAPLIACIQDSSQVYDFIVKLLFKLHSCLPPDTIEGHRLRFQKQFKALRQFYVQSSTLQYFKTLIQAPKLEENPPNFLISSELSRHVTPVVILPTVEVDEQLIQITADSPDNKNGSSSPDLLAERDRYIEHLLHQTEQFSEELVKMRRDCQYQINEWRQKTQELEMRLSEKETEVEEALKGKHDIESKLSEAAQSAQLGTVVQLQLQEMEKRAKASDEKFSKLKEVYQKLRDEHITLLRQKAEVDKKLSLSNVVLEQSNKIHSELQDCLEKTKTSLQEVTEEFTSYKTNHAKVYGDENLKLKEANEQLEQSSKDFEEKLQLIKQELSCTADSKQELIEKLEQSSTILAEKVKAQLEQEKLLEEIKHNSTNKEEEFNVLQISTNENIEQLTQKIEELESAKKQLEATIPNLEQQNESKLAALREEKQCLDKAMEELGIQHNSAITTYKLESLQLLKKLLVECSAKSEEYLDKCMIDLAKPPVMSLSDPDERGISAERALSSLDSLRQSLDTYLNDPTEENIGAVIPLIFPFAQCAGHTLHQCHQLAHKLPDIEKADRLLEKSMNTGLAASALCKFLQQESLNAKDLESASDQVRNSMGELNSLAESVSQALKPDANQGSVGEKLEKELRDMEEDILEAAARIAQLWNRSKETQTGVKLEVNEKILDSCTALMAGIIELIKKAKVLQEEIVARGKGSASVKEFYKRNHSWTEGLLSAAKAVGFGAKLLTDAADKVVQGQVKFEQLTVASQEIAASTAQLVFASRVKAELHSPNLKALADASKAVSLATGGVVAAAKHCAELVEDSTVLDFERLTLHQAKRLEMESQVKVLELESSLEKERLRLAALRRKHYQQADETNAY